VAPYSSGEDSEVEIAPGEELPKKKLVDSDKMGPRMRHILQHFVALKHLEEGAPEGSKSYLKVSGEDDIKKFTRRLKLNFSEIFEEEDFEKFMPSSMLSVDKNILLSFSDKRV
jgi:hypothetical protein